MIAIDGPAAAGKGTLARALAARLNFAYLDTGTLYRAVGLRAAAQGTLDDAAGLVLLAKSLQPSDLTHPDLRTPQAGSLASQVATQPEVRQALFDFQLSFGLTPPDGQAGAVLDGRDIGTVIFPDAHMKLFITARPQVRAQRRYDELPPDTRPAPDDLLRQVIERDARDSARDAAPLRPAADAHQIDTSHLDADQVLNLALSIYARLG